MKSVTILSTVKNIKETVRPWLDSLLSQGYNGKFDIVIIDSCSTDGTKEILMEYAKKYDKIRIEEYESTQPEALNYAINAEVLSGELVALIDGDCVAPKIWLQTLVKTLESKYVDAVGGPGMTPDNANRLQRIIGFDLDVRFLSIPEGLVKRHPNMNLLIKKSVLTELKFNEELHVGYDTDFGYRLNSKGYKLWYNPSAFVWHHHRAALKSYAQQQFQNGKYAFKLYKRMKKGLKGDNINPLTMTLQPIFLGLLLISLPLLLINSYFSILLIVLLIAIFTLFTIDVIRAFKIKKKKSVVLLYLLYTIRLPLWVVGAITEIMRSIRKAG